MENTKELRQKQGYTDEELQKMRFRSTCRNAAGIVLAGIVYIAVFRFFGAGIPCLFRKATGLLCPGCGMTHALAAVSRGHFHQAMEYNVLSLTLLPAILLYLLYRAVRYVRSGDDTFRIPELLFLIVCAGICVFYFLTRNHLL